VKQRIVPMLGFKRFANAAVVIAGIELAEKIKKDQFKTGKFDRATSRPMNRTATASHQPLSLIRCSSVYPERTLS